MFTMQRGAKDGLHPRNRFRKGYDFAELMASSPSLAAFVAPTTHGHLSIDYANPGAVKALNQALLLTTYTIRWDLPSGFLCPPIPGRSDYIHHLKDLLGNGETSGRPFKVLDIGTGANCIYPLLGAREYGWRFVATDVDREALNWARKLVSSNEFLPGSIECRIQVLPSRCFEGVVMPDESFDASMCNPPFHASAMVAALGNTRKRRNLGLGRTKGEALNFGGRPSELWCRGGEEGFVLRMIAESPRFAKQVRWFTTLVSKSAHLSRLQAALKSARVAETRVIEMAQGQKRTRILAWTFRDGSKASGKRVR